MSSLASSFVKTPTALVFDSRLTGDHVRCYTVIRYFHWKRTTITASLLASTLHTTERSVYRWLHQLARCGWVTFTPQRGIPWDESTIIAHDEVLTPESEPVTSSDTRVTPPPQDKTPVSKLKTPVSKLQGDSPHQEAVADAPLDHKIDLIQIDLRSYAQHDIIYATHRTHAYTEQEGTMRKTSEMQGRLWEDDEPPHPATADVSSYPKRSPQPPPVSPPPPSPKPTPPPRPPSLAAQRTQRYTDVVTRAGLLTSHRNHAATHDKLKALDAQPDEIQEAIERDLRGWNRGSYYSFTRVPLAVESLRVVRSDSGAKQATREELRLQLIEDARAGRITDLPQWVFRG